MKRKDRDGVSRDVAMTYAEIGRELGVSRAMAFLICKRALAKLRRRRIIRLRELRELAASKESNR